MSYNVALIDFVQFSRWCVFYSIMEYALANWLMRVEKRIEAAAVKVAKQEEAPEKAAEGSADVPPGTLVELGEVQVNGDAAPAAETPTGVRRRSIPSTVLSHAASFTDSVLKKRNNPAIKKHLHGVDPPVPHKFRGLHGLPRPALGHLLALRLPFCLHDRMHHLHLLARCRVVGRH